MHHLRKRTSTQLLLLSLENMKMKFKKWSGLGRELLDFWLPCPPILSPVGLCILYDWEILCLIQNSFSHSKSDLLDHLQSFISSFPLWISVSCNHGLQYGQENSFSCCFWLFLWDSLEKKMRCIETSLRCLKYHANIKLYQYFIFLPKKEIKREDPT